MIAQVTVTAPSAVESVRAADDFASQVLQDPWDMNERTDIGWFTQGIDQPPSNLANLSFANGIFSGVSSNGDPNFWLLDTGNPNAAAINKTGDRFPIQSTKYRRLLLRMNLSAHPLGQQMQVIWSNNTLYGGVNTSAAIAVRPGWWIYSIDLPTLGAVAGTPWANAAVDSLRIDPLQLANITVSLDWARLVEEDATLQRNITWTGAGAVEIYLDTDDKWANGNLGQIAASASGGTFAFYAGGLPYGSYKVAIRPVGSTATPSYSPGAYQIGDIPRVMFTSPAESGSADDFATAQLGNPWDMDALTDVDNSLDANGLSITNINAESDSGAALGSVRVLQGTSAAVAGTVGDPRIYPFFWTKRGFSSRIDSSRYRILNLEMGLEGERDINLGSVARIVWRVAGEAGENVSDDIILNHRPGANVIQTLITDMKTLPLEQGAGSPSQTGWNGLLDGFRVDPHEFPQARTFWIKSIALRAFERADASYAIRWNFANQDSAAGPSLSFFWDNDASGFNGTAIASGITPTAGSYTWNTSALPNGTYYIYTVVSVNGRTANQNYARWPIVIDHSSQTPNASITLGRPELRFGATQNGAIATGPQEVLVNVSGSGTVTWTATSNRAFLQVTPSSGTGSGRFTVSLNSTALPSPATLDGTITVTATGVQNSPQFVRIFVSVINPSATSPPRGVVDEPINNTSGLVGAIPVTGWAVDDVEVNRIVIYRKPVTNETPQPNGLIYIGDGIFLQGARPDVQALFPTLPVNDRAGWGLLVLTNMLPNSNGSPGNGNGTYQLEVHALDRDGKSTVLGSPTFSTSNATASKPFGTLDTPRNGEVISGTAYPVFGWALTPQPAIIPTDSSTIVVFVDGVPLGNPVYNQFRSDIASLFPNLRNSQGAVGAFILNTTLLSNGLHSIAWSVTDNQGRIEGIGSRIFYVQN